MLLGMTDAVTTTKVPRRLRERIAARAAEQRVTAAEVITQLLDDADRRARFDAVRDAYASTDHSSGDETAVWDSLAGDGELRHDRAAADDLDDPDHPTDRHCGRRHHATRRSVAPRLPRPGSATRPLMNTSGPVGHSDAAD